MTTPMNEKPLEFPKEDLIEAIKKFIPQNMRLEMFNKVEKLYDLGKNDGRSSALGEVSFGMPSMKFNEGKKDKYVEGYNDARKDVLEHIKSLISSKRGEEGK